MDQSKVTLDVAANIVFDERTAGILNLYEPEYVEQASHSSKDCVAAWAYIDMFPLTWLRIPCDIPVKSASFFCSNTKLNEFENNASAHYVTYSPLYCPPNWVLINSTCLYFIGDTNFASVNDGQTICEEQNGSVLDMHYTGFSLIVGNTGYYKTPRKKLFNYMDSFLLESVPWSYISGLEVSKDGTLGIMLNYILTSTMKNKLSLLITSNESTCWLLETTHIQRAFMPIDTRMLRDWGLRPRPCHMKLPIDMVICEKPATIRRYSCESHHFTCPDGTCVLIDYKCDDVLDCVDGYDEENCSSESMLSPDYLNKLQSLKLNMRMPCNATEIYNQELGFKIDVISFCDNIITCYESFEDEFCSYNQDNIKYDSINQAVIVNSDHVVDIWDIFKRYSTSTLQDVYEVINREKDIYSLNFTDTKLPAYSPIMMGCPHGFLNEEIDYNLCMFNNYADPCKTGECINSYCENKVQCTNSYVNNFIHGHDRDGDISMWHIHFHVDLLAKVRNTTQVNTSHTIYTISCPSSVDNKLSHVIKRIGSMCQYSKNEHVCYLSQCKDIGCPGKFKCPNSYCIPISFLCDEETDCIRGEDEVNCFSIVCPGMLKCRGETRCITHDQICDKHKDCLYSADDEVGCSSCPGGCQCTLYMANCSLDTFTGFTPPTYIKGLIFSGFNDYFPINLVSISNLLYLDLSYCGISTRTHTHFVLQKHAHILFLNLTNNNITHLSFISLTYLRKLIIIDLSLNPISFIQKDTFQNTPHLLLIRLVSIKIVNIEWQAFDLMTPRSLVIIQGILWYSLNIMLNSESTNIEYSPERYLGLVYVSDPVICCFLPVGTRCGTTGTVYRPTICKIFLDNHTKLGLMVLTPLSFLFLILTSVCDIIQFKGKTKRNYYLSIIFNIKVSESLIILYLWTLLLVQSFVTNRYLWSLSLMCSSLAALFIINYEANVIFKSFSCLFLLLKVLYPFKHQCLWLRKTMLICGLVWTMLFTSISGSILFITILPSDRIPISWGAYCNSLYLLLEDSYYQQQFTQSKLFSAIIVIIDCSFCISWIIFTLILLRRALKSLSDVPSVRQTRSTTFAKAVVMPLLAELMFRVCFLFYFNTFLMHSFKNSYILLLPLKIIGSQIFYILVQAFK